MLNPELVKFLEEFLTPGRRELFNKVIAQRTNHFTVATEDVYQLHNTSAVIRSCDVFGVQNIHVIEERNRKKIDREIAMGAQKWVSLNRHHSSAECITHLKENGYQIVATIPHGKAVNLADFDISKPSAIFFGTEKDGLSQEVITAADAFLKIPMMGFTDSLNISVSAAIILQHLTQKIKESNIKWELTENEKNALKYDWLSKTFKNLPELIKRFQDNA
ncbi:RNA methyltransferase [Antarcticibacterium arcticum]|uniref:tRNA (guanosine(18)-2'-O)-methyltransferase n=1 Tax=Antarcticibacterium arcticum TaxID=2585771 RepID=A0A5B8YJE3_9FLAO|nr:RNA methyltransferase [Antarcticibacterium arcticum]QED36743.1 RNA methyltransferase [Antarcticibacterium arcticum]